MGHDIYARFGNQYAMPIVGNFDPPSARHHGPTIGQVAMAQAKGWMSWNVVDADGVAGTTLAIDRGAGVERCRAVHRDIRRKLLRFHWER